MVYGDYQVCDESAGAMNPPSPPHPGGDGDVNRFSSKRLLDYHPGRLRETLDVGPVWLLDADTLKRAGGVNPAYHWAHLYDLRLRISERSQVAHVGNKTAGALYTVAARPAEHNVFDYLMTDQGAQREYERALTEHLQRIGAYLPPKRVVRHAPMVRTESLQPVAGVAVDGGGGWRRVASVVRWNRRL